MGTKLLSDALLEKKIDVTDADKLKFGTSPDNTEIDKTDGSLRYRGDSTMWKDMVSDLFGKSTLDTPYPKSLAVSLKKKNVLLISDFC